MPLSLNVVLLLNMKRADFWCVFLPDTFCTFHIEFQLLKLMWKCTVGKEVTLEGVMSFLAACSFVYAAPGALTCVTCWSDTVWTTSTARSQQESTPAIEDIPSTIKFCKRFVWFKVLPVGNASVHNYQRLFYVDDTYLCGEEWK